MQMWSLDSEGLNGASHKEAAKTEQMKACVVKTEFYFACTKHSLHVEVFLATVHKQPLCVGDINIFATSSSMVK